MYIGAHLSSSGGIHTAIDRAEAVGAEALQVFTQSPRTWRPTNHDPKNLDRFRERREEVGLQGVLCHALYLCNFATTKDDIYEKSVAALANTMQVACARSTTVPVPSGWRKIGAAPIAARTSIEIESVVVFE